MKTPEKIIEEINRLAPSVAIEVKWSHDPDLRDIRKDCDGFEDEDPDDWQAWQSEVRASAVIGGKIISGSAYLGGTWEKAVDHPEKSNPDISGYLPQMLEEAIEELAGQAWPANIRRECEAAIAFLKSEMRERYNEQVAEKATR